MSGLWEVLRRLFPTGEGGSDALPGSVQEQDESAFEAELDRENAPPSQP